MCCDRLATITTFVHPVVMGEIGYRGDSTVKIGEALTPNSL